MTDAGDKRLQLYLFSRRKLLGRAARLTGDGGIAEDLLQDAWLRFDAAAAGPAQRETLPYLRTIVDNLIRDWRRRYAVQSSLFAEGVETTPNDVPSLDPSPESHALARDDLRVLAGLLGAMPLRMRRAVEMHRLEGATLAQIAKRLAAALPTSVRTASAERAARADWQGDILAHLRPLLRYPRIAERGGQQGVTLVAIGVDRQGVVRSALIVRGSGYPSLDGEALATVKRGSPLPAPPADIPGDPVSVELPVQFSLRG